MTENITSTMFMWAIGGILTLNLVVMGAMWADLKEDDDRLVIGVREVRKEMDELEDEVTVHIVATDEILKFRGSLIQEYQKDKLRFQNQIDSIYSILMDIRRTTDSIEKKKSTVPRDHMHDDFYWMNEEMEKLKQAYEMTRGRE